VLDIVGLNDRFIAREGNCPGWWITSLHAAPTCSFCLPIRTAHG
jgi:hypothetical protein